MGIRKGHFILGDFSRAPDGRPRFLPHPEKWLGHAIVAAPFEGNTKIDFTSPLGGSSGLYYALTFQLRKWEFNVNKADEHIEVSPAFSQYYQLTQKQKEDLEGKIKQGLTSVAQSVADLELLKHDERKYREFLEYFGYRTKEEAEKDWSKRELSKEHINEIPGEDDDVWLNEPDNKRKKRSDSHLLKSVFIDQVDKHTGENISMATIVQRWPTIILDFQKLEDKHLEISKVSKDLGVSKAEAVVLVTKNKLYQEWKKIFEPQLKMRYQRIRELVRSRGMSVKEYREWLKPIIARHQLIKEGLARSSERKRMTTFFITSGGQATSSHLTEVFAWRDMTMPEFYKVPGELIAKKNITPYDTWTKKNLIFHKDQGLITEHPWITDAWAKEKLQEMYDDAWLKSHALYYSFFVIRLSRTNIRTATGAETENGIFDVNAIFMSQNAVFAKLLQLKAREEELDRYVSDLLGLSPDLRETKPRAIIDEKERFGFVSKIANKVNLGLEFMKKGPYEKDFEERITKYWIASMAKDRYIPLVGFLKQKVGFGVA
ncbi:hypothetical protein ACFLQN_04530 [Candidatus Aenigmatarchaeota archaeon]